MFEIWVIETPVANTCKFDFQPYPINHPETGYRMTFATWKEACSKAHQLNNLTNKPSFSYMPVRVK